jgi:hypothetical protein
VIAEARPILHEAGALLKEITTTIGGLDLVANGVQACARAISATSRG